MQKKEEEESPVSHKLAKQIAENQKSTSTYWKVENLVEIQADLDLEAKPENLLKA